MDVDLTRAIELSLKEKENQTRKRKRVQEEQDDVFALAQVKDQIAKEIEKEKNRKKRWLLRRNKMSRKERAALHAARFEALFKKKEESKKNEKDNL